jgi:DNA-binding XRE family transcriptional regulator
LDNNLAKLRKDANLTQKQLGELLDISGSAVAMYETNQRIPRLDKAKEIADLFDQTIEDVFYCNKNTKSEYGNQ